MAKKKQQVEAPSPLAVRSVSWPIQGDAEVREVVQDENGNQYSRPVENKFPLTVLIAIASCAADKHLEDACRATWAKENHPAFPWVQTVFFDGKMLGVGDSYDDLPIKIQAMCKWALEHGYDFMLKADVDTFIWVDRLMASGFEKHNYSGWTNPKFPDSANYASGGCGYWLSRTAMQFIALADLTKDTCEDRWVGKVLYDAGVKLHRNPLHAHGRHDEIVQGQVVTMHPCRSLGLMKKMQES